MPCFVTEGHFFLTEKIRFQIAQSSRQFDDDSQINPDSPFQLQQCIQAICSGWRTRCHFFYRIEKSHDTEHIAGYSQGLRALISFS